MDKELTELKKEVKDLKKTIVELDKKLSKHIIFIEQVYAPLQKSIDKFKRFFK
tara:strand:+ start:294 stop:452 length:159 start_codon:yes stop_codon:yes gene_type:complete